jgi:CRISPR-associated protein Cas1
MNKQLSLHDLPRFDDKLTYLYVEHAVVDQEERAIAVHRADGITSVPVAALAVLIMGPGTKITHEAVKTAADNNCLILWAGEHGVRFYAQGMGGTRHSRNLIHQARLVSHPILRLQVVVRMYQMRFDDLPDPGLTLQQLRGKEGIRVRQAYADAAREHGITWQGRSYKRQDWNAADPVNRALSAANACLYGLAHAAILSGGYSPALGFVHTGKQLSFVYDVADLYKARYIVPIAFKLAAQNPMNLEREVRLACRDCFREGKLAASILPDIAAALAVPKELAEAAEADYADDPALPADWWTPTGIGAETPVGQILAMAPAAPGT